MKTLYTLLFTVLSISLVGQNNNYLPDQSIERALENRLYMSQEVNSEDMKVAVDESVALLEGEVATFYEKEKAREIAGTTRGVTSVVDDLLVATPLKSDRALEEDVNRALLLDPATESYEIDVEAYGGTVSLFGKVSSLAEIRLAQDVVEGVKGVREIKNNLAVKAVNDRTDVDIQEDIIGLIRSDARIAPKDLDVDVDTGKVLLHAKVGTPYEREVMVQLSEVEGVNSIVADDVLVDPAYDRYWIKDPDAETVMEDKGIKQALELVFKQDARLKNAGIKVDVDDGNVHLEGDVEHLGLKGVAEDKAWNVIGVKTVDNLLLVEKTNKDNDVLRDDVIDALTSNPLLETEKMNVAVNSGIVTLSGTVGSNFLRYVAESEASGVKGVETVENKLSADYYPGYFSGSINYQVDTSKFAADVHPMESDAMIEQNIRYQLNWSPFVEADNLQIQVNEGVAIIEGRVTTQRQRQAIINNAYDAGAIAVVSDFDW